MVGFIDSDWVGDPDDQKSTIDYVFSLGLGPLTWAYKKQHVIYLSSAESEYREKINVSHESLWI